MSLWILEISYSNAIHSRWIYQPVHSLQGDTLRATLAFIASSASSSNSHTLHRPWTGRQRASHRRIGRQSHNKRPSRPSTRQTPSCARSRPGMPQRFKRVRSPLVDPHDRLD